jgi:hypothetical protein
MQSNGHNTANQSNYSRSFLVVGMAAQMSYVTAEYIAGYNASDYNYLDNTASELMAIGSSDRYFFALFYFLHAFFIALFGAGLIRQFSYIKNPSLYTGGILLVILGVSYALACSIFPMDPPDTSYTTSGYMHITLIGTGAFALLFSIPIITQGVYKEYNWKIFKRYTWMFLPLVILCGILSPIILYADIPLMGLAERIIGYLSSLWLLTLSYGLMKQLSTTEAYPGKSSISESKDSDISIQSTSKSENQNIY